MENVKGCANMVKKQKLHQGMITRKSIKNKKIVRAKLGLIAEL